MMNEKNELQSLRRGFDRFYAITSTLIVIIILSVYLLLKIESNSFKEPFKKYLQNEFVYGWAQVIFFIGTFFGVVLSFFIGYKATGKLFSQQHNMYKIMKLRDFYPTILSFLIIGLMELIVNIY